jgi:hypothetical protein
LGDFFSEGALSKRGWVIDEMGRIIDQDGEKLSKPGLIDAINKVLTILTLDQN